jgi:hypothetical protein
MGKKKTPLIYFNSNQIQIKFLKSHILQSHKIKDVTELPAPLIRISSSRLRNYLRFEEVRVFLPHHGLLLPRCFVLRVITLEHLAEACGDVPG